MKKIIYLIAAIFISASINAQETSKVLFVGNSYTTANNLPQMLSDLTTSMGDVLNYAQRTQGGATFATHAGNAATYTSIKADAWDFVIFQAQSQEPSFPDGQVDTGTIPFAMQMADSVYANNACTEIMMYMTWGRQNGDPQWAPISTYSGMQDRLSAAYLRIVDSVDGVVAPVGEVWRYVRGNHPSINLYSSDGSHPSAAGTYLAACTFYAALYQKSPVGASFTSSLSAQDAVNIQAAAAAVYFDDLDIWQVSPNTEYTTADFSFDNSSLAVGFTNLSTQADTYAWQFGDGNSSNDINPTNTYAGTGIYSVELISTSSCDADTVQYDVDLSTLSLNNQNLENIKVEMIQRGKYAITGFETVNDLKVFSLEGKNIAAEFSVDDKLVVNFNAVNATRYFVVIVQGNKLHQFALPVVVD